MERQIKIGTISKMKSLKLYCEVRNRALVRFIIFCLVARISYAANHKVGRAPQDRPSCQWVQPNEAAGNRSTIISDDLSTGANMTTTTPSALKLDTPSVMSLSARGRLKTLDKKLDTSERLRQLRQLIASNNYDAYLVGSNDEHGSEYVTEYDRRLRYISGFAGSSGIALITHNEAVLFTDGRYAIQAELDLDCNWWIVICDNIIADIDRWLQINMPQKPLKLATDARLMSLDAYDMLQADLRAHFNSDLILISQDLVDVVWNNEVSSASPKSENLRPKSLEPIFIHPIQFNGNVSWQEKVARLTEIMARMDAHHYVISRLENIAWLLNLRGKDIPKCPLFKSYLFISRLPAPRISARRNDVSIIDTVIQPGIQAPQVLQMPVNETVRLILYVDQIKIDNSVREHLHVENGTLFSYRPLNKRQPQVILDPTTLRIQVELKDYDTFIDDFRNRLTPDPSPRSLQGRLLLDAKANVAIHVLAKAHEDRYVMHTSLIDHMKAAKTDGEVEGMRQAHWRDSLAISMLLSQLDQDIGQKKQLNKWTEVSAAKELEFYRSLMDHNMGQSFESISAYGSNAAIVHYQPKETDRVFIGNTSTYLLDSGGQYLDGTTDITRTVHFGQPSDLQRETYTRVLMGAIDFMSFIFFEPTRDPFRISDLLVRRHLLELGFDYQHGTGHGIGLFSLVHESPNLIENYQEFAHIRSNGRDHKDNTGKPNIEVNPIDIQPNMFTSIEPGFYKENDFGIRLENIVVTQRISNPANSRGNQSNSSINGRQLLRFEPLSLVPFEPKLIKFELLSNQQKAWLNSYNLLVRLRMTQQVNYHLSKLRQIQQLQKGNKQAIQVNGNLSSSRLYTLLFNPTNQTNVDGSTSQTPPKTQSSSPRIDLARFQEKLEQVHKWVTSKTELIPLDLPQHMTMDSLKSKRPERRKSHTLNAQKLMFAYMSSLPFNDQTASEMIMALASQENLNSIGNIQSLRPRADVNDSNLVDVPSHKANSTGNECYGAQCELLLLSKLVPSREQSQLRATIDSKDDRNWIPSRMQLDTNHDDPIELEDSIDDDGGTNSFVDRFFSLNRSDETVSWMPSRYVVVGVASLLILQAALTTFVCKRRWARSRSVEVETPNQLSISVGG